MSSKLVSRRLLKRLGVEKLRPGQREVIESVLAGRDTLAIMPSGGGKSLCYQLPALQLEGTTLVVSPLISLMKDQADKLSEKGVEATALNSTLNGSEEQSALREVRRGEAEIVFTTPEVIEDIKRQLERPGMQVMNGGVYRPNLRFAVRQVTSETEKFAVLLDLVRKGKGSGIVYVSTVKVAEEIHRRLRAAGEDALLYHGRVAASERSRCQEAFMSGASRLMVATNAFGMGIDKPDIRFVLHYQMPGSLEAYYQEAGRAGRDGNEAHCTLLYDHADRRVQLFFAGGADKRKSAVDRDKVERMSFYAQSALCRWETLLEYFGETSHEPCGHCDNCLRPKRVEGREVRVAPAEPAWQRGEAVVVPKYGRGVVEDYGPDRVAISFPNGVKKAFAPRFVSRVA